MEFRSHGHPTSPRPIPVRQRRLATARAVTTQAPGRSLLQLVDGVVRGDPVLDTAASHALLRGVGAGRRGPALRLYAPEDAVLFSLLDARRPGFPRAVEIAREAGFAAVLRLAGGHAAVFHPGTLAFSWARPAADAHLSIGPRFDEMVSITLDALRSLGVDARAGEVPGEYCPGEHSVNARGRTKLMGVGQRVIRGAAHVGGVVVVDGAARVRDVLVPVYEALELDWRAETAGSVEDEIGRVGHDEVRSAFLAAFARAYELEPGEAAGSLIREAEALREYHDPAATPRSQRVSFAAAKIVHHEDGERSP